MITECKRLLLEQYAGGELDEAGQTEVRRHLDTCPDCSSFIARLETERADFLRRYPFSSFTRAHTPLVVVARHRRVFRTVLQPALMPVYAVALLALAVVPLRHAKRSEDPRFKGAHSLSFLYERGGIVTEGMPGIRFRANDRIQILFSLLRQRHVALLSIDSFGKVSFYHPDQEAKTCSIIAKPGNRTPFPGSIVLDDSRGSELVIALFSDTALHTGEVVEWVRQEFKECPHPDRLQERLRSRGKIFNAQIATLLLRKE